MAESLAAEPSSLKRKWDDDKESENANNRVVSEDYGEETGKDKAIAESTPNSRKGKEKEKRNAGRRSRRGTRQETDSIAEERAERSPRLPKRQCALLIGFCGSGFNGMQIQRDVRTIEGTLFHAMVKVGAVSKDNADDPVKVNLGRAARTDAGVHAAGNVVSIKMIVTVPGIRDIVARINEELPPEIRVWGYVRVQNSFNARTSCDSRKYTYFFPTYLLVPPKPGSRLHAALQKHSTSSEQSSPSTTESEMNLASQCFWESVDGTPEDDLARKRRWRIAASGVDSLREAAKKFEGTHNFHNFTLGREFRDRSNNRYMKSIEISEPAVYGETEWISVLFLGQSFMLHQVLLKGSSHVSNQRQRKMMSALVLSCRTGTPSRIIDELYGPREVLVPKMPALGLLLENPIFDSYNTKIASVNAKLQPTDADYRPPIDFEVHRDKMEKFKQEFIYDNMRNVEDRDGIFDSWIRSIDAYAGEDLSYLNQRGVIPATAVIKRGERGDRPFQEKKVFDATSFASGGHGNVVEAEEADETEQTLDSQQLVDLEG